MTIEKEAREIAENIVETYLHKSLQENDKMFSGIEIAIGKALQKKQERILELEEKVREYKWEWESACERERATNERVKELSDKIMEYQRYWGKSNDLIEHNKRLNDRVEYLEHLLHGHSDDVLRVVFQKIKTLESALKDANLLATGYCYDARKIQKEYIALETKNTELKRALEEIAEATSDQCTHEEQFLHDRAKKAIGGVS